MDRQNAAEQSSSHSAVPAERSLGASVGIGGAAFMVSYVLLGFLLFVVEGGAGARPSGTGWLIVYVVRSVVEGAVGGFVTARRRGSRWLAACCILAGLTALFSALFATGFGLYSALAHLVAVLLGGWVVSRRAVEFSIRHLAREREPTGNYEYEILKGGEFIARYWHDFRGDEHGMEFVDGSIEDSPMGHMTDFLQGGGPEKSVLSSAAVEWLRRRTAV